MSHLPLTAFRLGDVRGIYPDEVDETFAFAFARAFAQRFALAGSIATGRDMRTSSESLQHALNEGFVSAGIDVRDLGLCATELGYFASTQPGISAVVIVTASHNAAHYNGFKCVLTNGEAVTFDTGLCDVMSLMRSNREFSTTHRGLIQPWDLTGCYIDLLQQRFRLDPSSLAHVALNGLNGTAATLAGTVADKWHLPVTWFRKEPGPMPDQGADPTHPALLAQMKGFMQQGEFSLGVAWDGDCDRCVFFDAAGDLVPTYYIIGLLAEHFLQQHPGAAVVYDTKLCWNTLRIIERSGGTAVASETGHAFMKRKMRERRAIYGGELSSHHFFGDFAGCDSGMFAWLTILDRVSRSGHDLGEMVASQRDQICCTPEINLRLTDPSAALAHVRSVYARDAHCVDEFDGVRFEMRNNWRFSLTESKTESVVRLNMESRDGAHRLLEQGARLLDLLRDFQSDNTDHSSKLIIQ